jgi:hypothetical protein
VMIRLALLCGFWICFDVMSVMWCEERWWWWIKGR